MRDLLRKLRRLFSPREQAQAAGLGVLMVGGALLEMVGVGAIPAFVTLLSDPAAAEGSAVGRALLGALGAERAPDRTVLCGALALFALFAVKNVYLGGVAYAQARFAYARQAALAERLVAAYLHSPYPFHLQRNSSDLLRNANQEAMEVVGSGLMPLLMLAMEGLTVAALLGLLLSVEPAISLVTFAVLGGTGALFLRAVRARMARHGRDAHEARGAMVRAVNEGLGGIKVTKVLGREGLFVAAFQSAARRFAAAGRGRQVLLEAPRLLLETVAMAGLLGIAAYLLARGEAVASIVPTLALVAVAVTRMIPSVNRVSSALNSIRYGRHALDAVYDDLLGLEADEAPTAAPMTFEREIVLEGVHFRYPGAAEETLRGVTARITKGEAVGFIGTTGAGKTTLIDVVLGLLEPTRGRVLVDGRDVHASPRAWQQLIGYVAQDVFLTDDTIRRNVALGVPDADIDEPALRRALAIAHLDAFLETLPDRADTVVGERGVRLSGGQRQRIGVARALYHDPEVLVFDEATSALDQETERAVMEAVEQLHGSRTILMITHRMATVRACDRVFRLAGGRVVAEMEPAGVAA